MQDVRTSMTDTTIKVLWPIFSVAIFLAGPIAWAHEHGWELVGGVLVSGFVGGGAAALVASWISYRAG